MFRTVLEDFGYVIGTYLGRFEGFSLNSFSVRVPHNSSKASMCNPDPGSVARRFSRPSSQAVPVSAKAMEERFEKKFTTDSFGSTIQVRKNRAPPCLQIVGDASDFDL